MRILRMAGALALAVPAIMATFIAAILTIAVTMIVPDRIPGR